MSGTEPQGPQPGPGWYPDPEGRGHRWWDGARWTDHYAATYQPAGQPAPGQVSSGLETSAWVFAVLLPIVGFILAIVMLSNTRGQKGIGPLLLSVGVFVVFLAAVSSSPA